MWMSVLLLLLEAGGQGGGTPVHCVGNSSMKAPTLFPIGGLTLEKSPMTVATVGKASTIKQTSINMSESTQERNLIPVLSVGKTFAKILIGVAMKEST